MIDSTKKTLSVCVFCASSETVPEAYRETARILGREMAARGIRLVYGGGNNGLMGVLAEEIHRCGGFITGVIPLALRDLGYAYAQADEIIVTDGLRERKAVMEERAGGFIGLPGGFGTLEEMMEIITLRQLGMHDKPVVFLNTGGFFTDLLGQFERGYREGFIPEECRSLYAVEEDITRALDRIRAERTV
jgi:cytokinin riboside 5'-monophosphate phosphoribohydrolase